MSRTGPRRVLRPTLLIVGEGYAEQWFLRHLRAIYTAGGRGPSVTVDNARGKGAKNVIEKAISRSSAFDSAAAFFDTDTDWDQQAEAMAKKSGIILFPSSPCFEALLLDIAGCVPADTSAKNKKIFIRKFNGQAHQERIIASRFGKDVLDAAGTRVKTLKLILRALGEH